MSSISYLNYLNLFFPECAMPCEETSQLRNWQLDRDANPRWPSVWSQYQEENWTSNSFVWRWVQVAIGWLWYALWRQNFVRHEWRPLSGRCHDTNFLGSNQWWTKEQSSRYFMLFISKSFLFPFFQFVFMLIAPLLILIFSCRLWCSRWWRYASVCDLQRCSVNRTAAG